MFQFSFWQRLLLGLGLFLMVLSLSLRHVTEIWDAVFAEDNTVYWNNLAVSPGKNERISRLDDATLVIRSASRPHARLTLFTREDDGAQPVDLVKDLCGRDSCVYFPLDDAWQNGAVADYRSDTPLRIVLMHPAQRGVWIEYKGPPGAYEAFSRLIDAIVTQIRDQDVPEKAA
jgi:hypothetical protein